MENSVLTFQKDSAKYIYHYTKAETAIDYILKDGTLKFSPFNKTNDPKESKNWFFIPTSNEGRDLTKYTPEYLSELLNPYFKNSTQLLCFSTDGVLTGNHLVDTPQRGFCKPRMWAQYGGNHTGVCLIFDYAKLNAIFLKTFSKITYKLDYVNYKDRNISEIQMAPSFIINIDHLEKRGPKDYAYDHLLRFQERLYFEKAQDWSNESEFRFAIFERSDTTMLQFQNSLAGIIFGENCSEADISKIAKLVQGQGVILQQLKWRNCTPWFDFNRTKWL